MAAWIHAAEPPALESIWTTCVDEAATVYGTFQSHNQKVVSNRRGYFMAYLRSRNEEYTAQQWRLIWSQDGGRNWRVLHEGTNATNPAVLETDAEDNVYLVRPDWGDAQWSRNTSYLYRFHISRPEEFEVHSWLWNLLAKGGKLHFTYQAQFPEGAQQRYVRYDLRTGKPDVDIAPRFGGEALPMCRLDGFFASDDRHPGSPLHCVGNAPATSNRVTCIVSHDNGATWHDYAQSPPTFTPLYAIGGCRQVTADGYVIGSFTEPPVGSPAATASKVYFLKIRASASSQR